ncbi:MAG: hypothetical protein KF883_01405 [Thermomicrobiales bacterium]|nr:hypothetical protein [Thermomicrobiales bacterium]
MAIRLGIDEALRTRSANGNAAGRYQVSLNEYVAEAILGAIPDRLSDFVLRATAHDAIDPALATVLWGDAGGASLLSDCVAYGLPLNRADTDSPTWRWNPAFAAQTRRILAARDPQLAIESAVLAANGLRSTAPSAAAGLALEGQAPQLAFEIIEEYWILWLLEDRVTSLDRLCRRLPLPWSERPDTLLIRACCSQRSRQEEEASRLRARAQQRSGLLGQSERDRFDVLHTYAELLLATGDDALDRASKRAVAILDQQSNERPALHASVLFLAGFAEMRLRRDGRLAVSLLQDAASIYLANGMEALGHRATAYAAFVHAYHGEFNDAVRTVAPGTAVAAFGGKEINGAIWLARGWVAYWRNDLDAAESSLRLAAEALDEPPAGPSTALQFLVLTAAARGHSADLSRAIDDLNRIAPDGAYGIPWESIRRTVAALIAERRGDLPGARELARTASTGEHVPINAVLLAALHRRLGDHARARRCLADAGVAAMPYTRAHAAVVEALLSLDEGRRDEAHLALERALDCAAPEGVRRCFAENAADLRPLLEEHSIWGTSHEALVLDLLHDSGSPPVDFGLSPRELEILRFMRTRITAAEMAEALYISIATVKTHQRSIYRKLGVRNRREALIAALTSGLI